MYLKILHWKCSETDGKKKPGSQRCLKTLKRPRLGENHRTFELVEISIIFFY